VRRVRCAALAWISCFHEVLAASHPRAAHACALACHAEHPAVLAQRPCKVCCAAARNQASLLAQAYMAPSGRLVERVPLKVRSPRSSSGTTSVHALLQAVSLNAVYVGWTRGAAFSIATMHASCPLGICPCTAGRLALSPSECAARRIRSPVAGPACKQAWCRAGGAACARRPGSTPRTPRHAMHSAQRRRACQPLPRARAARSRPSARRCRRARWSSSCRCSSMRRPRRRRCRTAWAAPRPPRPPRLR
jgi:hypothetical protein